MTGTIVTVAGLLLLILSPALVNAVILSWPWTKSGKEAKARQRRADMYFRLSQSSLERAVTATSSRERSRHASQYYEDLAMWRKLRD